MGRSTPFEMQKKRCSNIMQIRLVAGVVAAYHTSRTSLGTRKTIETQPGKGLLLRRNKQKNRHSKPNRLETLRHHWNRSRRSETLFRFSHPVDGSSNSVRAPVARVRTPTST